MVIRLWVDGVPTDYVNVDEAEIVEYRSVEITAEGGRYKAKETEDV
jgi:hypothetical protein